VSARSFQTSHRAVTKQPSTSMVRDDNCRS